MIRTIIIFFLLSAQVALSQSPMLKVYVDTKEIEKTTTKVYAYVKCSGKYYSLLQAKDKSITLPEEVEFHKIEGLRFIVKNDTITFPVEKILEDLKEHPEKNMVDELYAIFKEVSKWELRIDNFKYTSKEQLLASGRLPQKRGTIYDDYRIYSLRTTNLKYYIVKQK